MPDLPRAIRSISKQTGKPAVRRTKVLLPILILAGMLAIAACSFSLPEGAEGSIALIPFWDEEQGIQGVQPMEGWSEEATLRQVAVPFSSEEAIALLLKETDLSALPEATGRFKGMAFTWTLYEFESHLEELPVGILHFDMAVAESESTTYVIGLLALPDAYETNRTMYDTIYTHALYAFEPME
jgi:hypothetical protein